MSDQPAFTWNGVPIVPNVPNTTLAIPGQYISGSTAVVPGSLLAPEGVMHFISIIPGRNVTIDQLAVNVEVAGSTGSKVRLGIYNDNGQDQPGTLRLDAGLVSTDTVGLKGVSISNALTGGTRYWLCTVQQGGAVIAGTYTSFTSTTGTVTVTSPGGTFNGALKLGVTGGLPSPAAVPSTLLGSQVMVRILARIA